MEEEKIVEALKTIHDYCNKQKGCSECPLSNEQEYCLVNEMVPNEWTEIKITKKITLD